MKILKQEGGAMRVFINYRKSLPIIMVLGLILISLACQPENSGPQAVSQERAQQIGEIYEEARNTGHLDLLDSIYSPEVAVHDDGYPTDICGLDELKTVYSRTHIAMPDVNIKFDDMYISGDRIFWVWTFSGTNTGPFGDMPATDKSASVSGVAIDRIENDMIVEEWVYWNTLELYSQLGFTLQPPASDSAEVQEP
jgi:steroid delta-isomerase-like uncharacterized protein